MKSLYDQNDVLRQTYTVTIEVGRELKPGDRAHALLNEHPTGGEFSVTDCEGRVVGTIRGESGRVLAQELEKNHLTTLLLTVTATIPVTGDARVQILPE